jgi:hypothetical protein
MNHHGTPFIAGRTIVSSPNSGAIASLAAASAGALRAMTTSSLRAERGGVVAGGNAGRERAARALDLDAVGVNSRQRRAAGERRHFVAGAASRAAIRPPTAPIPTHRDPHGATAGDAPRRSAGVTGADAD